MTACPLQQQLKGDFSFLADNGTSCPRQVKALINFSSSVKDNVHYSLDCTNGHFSGVAPTAEKPGGGYVAPALVTFDITADHASQLRAEVGRPRQAEDPHA